MKLLKNIHILFMALGFSLNLHASSDLSLVVKEMSDQQYNNLVVQLSVESWINGQEDQRQFFLSLKDRWDLREELIKKLETINIAHHSNLSGCGLGILRCELGEKILLFLDRT